MNIQSNINQEGESFIRNGKRDGELVQRERNYIERIFLRYRADLHRYIKSMVRSDDDAHDLLQETYLKVCNRKNIEDLDANVKGYLFVVATNAAKDFIRKRVSRHEAKHICINSVEIEADNASPEAEAEWSASLNAVKASLLKLDSRTKQVFIMRRFMGYSSADIAKHLKVSKRTVERDLITALDTIKSDLNKRNSDD